MIWYGTKIQNIHELYYIPDVYFILQQLFSSTKGKCITKNRSFVTFQISN